MTETPKQYFNRRFESLKSDRTTFESHWREISQYIQPRMGRFVNQGKADGSKKNGSIIDNTATIALRVLAAGMMTGLTSPARPWFKLGLEDKDLEEDQEVKEWLNEVTKRMLAVYAGSNIYNSFSALYSELGAFGTGSIFIDEDFDDVIHTTVFTTGEYYIALNSKGLVDTLYREIWLTVDQIVEEYGIENCSTSTKMLWEKGNVSEKVKVRIAIEPNRKRNIASIMTKDGAPWRDVHWEAASTENKFLRESGYWEFPAPTIRWYATTNDAYGTDCPGMTALGDVKQLQGEQKDKGIGIQKMVKPPMKGSASLKSSVTNTLPGGLTYLPSGGDASFEPAHEVRIDLNHLSMDIAQVQDRIDRAFFKDIFLMISQENDVRTATENMMRQEEKLLMLGPVLQQTKFEGLDQIVKRTYGIMDRQGRIPPVPEALDGVKIEVEYISMLAQAQKSVTVGSIERMAGFIGSVAQMDPTALDKFNVDKAIEEYGEGIGVAPQIINSEEETDQIRQARAEAQAQRQAAEQMQPAADALKKVSEIDTSGDNLVSNVLGGP